LRAGFSPHGKRGTKEAGRCGSAAYSTLPLRKCSGNRVQVGHRKENRMARRKSTQPAGGGDPLPEVSASGRRDNEQQTVGISVRGGLMMAIDSSILVACDGTIHSAEKVDRSRGRLREFGFVRPLLTGGAGNLTSGHGPLEDARGEAMDVAPWVVVEGLSDA